MASALPKWGCCTYRALRGIYGRNQNRKQIGIHSYEVKRGKYTAVKGKGQKRFIRFRTLGTGYSEEEIKAVPEDKTKHQPYRKKPPKEQPFRLLVDIQGKMAEGKSVGY